MAERAPKRRQTADRRADRTIGVVKAQSSADSTIELIGNTMGVMMHVDALAMGTHRRQFSAGYVGLPFSDTRPSIGDLDVGNLEPRSAFGSLGYLDGPFVGFNDLFDDRQAESGPVRI